MAYNRDNAGDGQTDQRTEYANEIKIQEKFSSHPNESEHTHTHNLRHLHRAQRIFRVEKQIII